MIPLVNLNPNPNPLFPQMDLLFPLHPVARAKISPISGNLQPKTCRSKNGGGGAFFNITCERGL